MLPLARVLLLCASGAVGPLVLPGVGPDDDRVPVNPSQLPWRAVGRVQMPGVSRCTGFLVTAQQVVTAAHCLYRREPAAYMPPSSIHFLLGYDRGQWVAHARVSSFRVGPGYDPARERDTSGADWAVLTLDRPVGAADQILPLATTRPAAGTPAVLGGYGRDRAEVLEADLGCAVIGFGHDGGGRVLIAHSCAGTNGTSGAPLLVRERGGWVAAGIQLAAVKGQSGGIALDVSSVRLIP